MKRLLVSVDATAEEKAADRAGDALVTAADAVMDRTFTLEASPEQIWPWLVQLGKQRAGWYLPRSVERFIPPSRRAIRTIDPRWQEPAVGDVIPDYGGRHETFEVASLEPRQSLVYTSTRGHTQVSWSLTLTADRATASTRLHLRLRLGPVRRAWLVNTVGELFDALTIAGLAGGLRERLSEAGDRMRT